MPEITAIFSDVGGVLLTNGWDTPARARAVEQFHLDGKEFEERHALLMHALEIGAASLGQYLDWTVFHQPRSFSRDDFRAFILAQSQPLRDAMDVFGRLARSRKYLLATLNNESFELNEYRIEQFRLRDYFSIFLTSCYLGVRKPEEGIYRLALRLTQRPAAECIFIDDRRLNLEFAAELGMQTILYQDPAQLVKELRHQGIDSE